MRNTIWVWALVLVFGPALAAGSLYAQIDDPYELRLFERPNYDDPYIDWLGSASGPHNIYCGTLPLDPFELYTNAELVGDAQNGSVSIFDPTFQRKGFQIPNGSCTSLLDGSDSKLLYVLMGNAGGPETCGYAGNLGSADADGDGVGEFRYAGSGDLCDSLGRQARQVGACAPEFVEAEQDQYGNWQHLENSDPIVPSTGHRCQVILLTLSAMWCGPCINEAHTAEALYQEYRDPNGDGVDDFIIMEVLIEDEQGAPADMSDCDRWANNNWQSGALTFPVLADGNYSVWSAFHESNSLPTNVIIGADFVIADRFAGWSEARARDVIESELCKIMPTGTTVGDSVCP